MHPDSPNKGSFWMSKDIVFSKVKLTNNSKCEEDGVVSTCDANPPLDQPLDL